MKKLDRRRFVIAAAAVAASGRRGFAQSAEGSSAGPVAATLLLHPERTGATIPANFVGLSYETQQLSAPEFFSPANRGLIAQFRALAPHGVLRLGGNTSDYGFWKATADAVPPPRAPRPNRVGDPAPDLSYPVTPEAVRNLRGFLDATGWTCLYGINFGTNTPELAADEAAFVSKTLGPRLEYFQVGNEADRFGSTIRDPKTWNANSYFDEWIGFANAIRARVRAAKFGMPDTSGNPEWYAVVVDRLLELPQQARPRVAALTHHYYWTGPPDNPRATIANLLQRDPHVLTLAGDIRAAAARLAAGERADSAGPAPFRMTEGNTCYRGGKPGLSDVFAASLWAADYLLQLAQLGYAGANLHGGDGQMVANSLGGKLPGDALVTGDPALHPHPYYTPIAHLGESYVAEPVSFGMRFAQQFAGATVLGLDFDPGEVNATAYAAREPGGQVLIGIVNKDARRDLKLDLRGYRIVQRLTAESLSSTAVQFGAVALSSLTIPAASAALLRKA